ncbi:MULTISPECIES: coenzyme F420-0:L-glutamate ligase [Sporomusa]|uniref:F420-0:Gamma-glutamyl ligase n=1 Tax=Sporomusa sphaeroides DSM 2875 TaxID=1337886 RepID=A0ABM9WA74_9FIRM|nr:MULTISPECIES: coenzyme F420-0:L-glutamate ligase [Sporomusa]MCM0759136.1 coenzyme F420-0:L-glutamate ligase [Sporomusa sphaeroides DSM 2875]OLS54260.1 F420-0:gamma-glutamyl ligase [Sporomusa sphaeroides DSM 2875]CVK21680.1 F420-0:Gamma-glutamyl ligase [Sporomusa sphaeroides DSM 2875]
MARTIGTVVRGIRTPVVKEGDNIIDIVVSSVLQSSQEENYQLKDGDVIGVTESLVARSQGNYVSLTDIADDINSKFKGDIAVLFPILSRNRFSLILKGIAMSGKKIHLFLNYPSDEVGNHLIDVELMDDLGINPYTDMLTEEKYRQMFGNNVAHPFTGIDYVQLYKDIAVNGNIQIYLTNDPKIALNYTKEILVANIHERHRTKRMLKKAGADTVYGLDDLMTHSVNGSGFNADYGLLGSNKATEDKVKLFPRNCNEIVGELQKAFKQSTGKQVEVMIYGDGAFKDPQGKIWELADPVVSPGYTSGLFGTPNEIKIKYVADNEMKALTSEALTQAIKDKIKDKSLNLCGKEEALGTTPRQYTDLLGSLCDLTSGSGDKGTPVVLVQGYFDNYATE